MRPEDAQAIESAVRAVTAASKNALECPFMACRPLERGKHGANRRECQWRVSFRRSLDFSLSLRYPWFR